jgi:hypothetical protein
MTDLYQTIWEIGFRYPKETLALIAILYTIGCVIATARIIAWLYSRRAKRQIVKRIASPQVAKTLLAIIALATLSGTAFARIGETYAPAVARYGQPVRTDKMPYTRSTIYRFTKGRFMISATFMNDRISWIEYVTIGPSAIR